MPGSTCFDPIKFQIAFRSVLLKLFDVTYLLFFFLLLFQRARDWRAKLSNPAGSLLLLLLLVVVCGGGGEGWLGTRTILSLLKAKFS